MKHDYIPAIDGLRAYSILSVILYHINPRWIPGGYLGVDVFFVISGFLITRILAGSNSKTFSETLLSFYLQRSRRILPALVALTLIVLLLGNLLEGWSSFHFLISQAPAILCSYTNFANYQLVGDYFGETSESFHFLHSWSLSVEEQFYLTYPWLLLGLRRSVGIPRAVAILACLAAVSLFSFYYYRVHNPAAGFYLPWNRAWELLIGALIALRTSSPRGLVLLGHPLLRQAIQGIAFATIIACLFVAADRQPRLQILLAFVVCGSTAILLDLLVRDESFSPLGLENRVIRWIGRVSYSAYLWHWPILVFVRSHSDAPYMSIPSHLAVPVMAVLILLCSAVSFLMIENPLRSWRYTPHFIVPATALLALFTAILTPTFAAGSRETFRPELILGNRFCYNPHVPMVQEATVSLCFPKPRGNLAPTNRFVLPKEGQKTVLLFGNSHCLGFAPIVNRIGNREGLLIQNLFANGVSPVLVRRPGPHGGGGMNSEQVDRYDEVRRNALNSDPSLCVLAMRYDHLNFEEVAPTLDLILEKIPLVFIQQAPVLNIGQGNAVDRFNELIEKVGSANQLRVFEPGASRLPRQLFEQRLLARYADNSRFHFISTSDRMIGNDGSIAWFNNKRHLYYFDNDHLTEAGAMRFEDRILASFHNILGGQE